VVLLVLMLVVLLRLDLIQTNELLAYACLGLIVMSFLC